MRRKYTPQDISVVIPTHNSAGTIVPLIESILGQDLRPGEILIADDCSGDRTVDLVRDYPVKVVRQEKNGGSAKTRNLGIKEAKGEVVMFLDSDTCLMPGAIKAVLDGFNDNENVCAQNGWCRCEPLNRGWFPLYKGLVENSWGKDLPEWDDTSKCINARVGAFLRSTLIEMGGFDEKYPGASVEDHEFGLRYTSRYRIFFNKKLMVRHHFPGFLKTAKNYWDRTREFMSLARTYKSVMDSGGTSRDSALQYIFGAATLILLPVCIFLPPARVVWALSFIIFVFLSGKVLKAFFGQGFLFGIFGTVVHAAYGIVIMASAVFYHIDVFLRRGKNESTVL